MKWIVIIAFVLIIGSMASAMVFLIRDRGRTRNVVRSLALRVGFSVVLFVLILLANYLGWIESTGIPVRSGG
ncbi:MAG: twin transmembrane helix small protein [Quisquiliibacterium sp.]